MTTQGLLFDISQSIKKHWDISALSDYKGETNTYKQVAEKIARLHILFEKFGIKQGDKISLIGRNQSNWGISFLAIISYGAVAVPIAHEYRAENIYNVVNHSDSLLLLTGDVAWQALDENEMPNLIGVIQITDFSVLSAKQPNLMSTADELEQMFAAKYPQGFTANDINYYDDQPNDLAILNYTSGTTGFSKGVMIPYRALWSNTRYIHTKLSYVQEGTKMVSMLPLSHMYGLTCELLFEFIYGCHVHFLSRVPSPKILLDAFADVKPIIVVTVPLVLEKIYKNQIQPVLKKPIVKFILKIPVLRRSLYKMINKKLVDSFGGVFRDLTLAGAPLNPEVEAFLKKIGFRYTVGYGMTECSPLITFDVWNENRLYACGRKVDGMEVKINSTDPEKIVGEILTRGRNVMLGYYKNPEITNEVLVDGWLHTGDLGVIDKNGYVYIKGRSKNVILGPSGQNIFPEEIEALLNNMDYVSETLVVERDGKITALIFPDRDQAKLHKISDKAIAAILEENRKLVNTMLPTYSQVVQIEIRDEEFEKTPKRSIKRFAYQ